VIFVASAFLLGLSYAASQKADAVCENVFKFASRLRQMEREQCNTIAIEFVIYRIDPAAMESYAHHEREVIEVARACHCAKTGNPNNPNQEGLMNPFEV
jgi:hypothetical protein